VRDISPEGEKIWLYNWVTFSPLGGKRKRVVNQEMNSYNNPFVRIKVLM
jgi:hemolysin-activating ACP:hemolysin acyltransferase